VVGGKVKKKTRAELPGWSSMNDDQIVDRFSGVTVWRAAGQRAPHKPLLILWSLAKLQRGEDRLVKYEELDGPFRKLLHDFGPPRKSYHPEYPFWHLQSDDLWVIPERATLEQDLSARSRKNNPPKSVLIRERARGGFPEDLASRLRADPQLMNRIAHRVLEDNFPQSVHDDILDAVGMQWVAVTSPRRTRDPNFREMILRIYQHRCAICGWDGILDNASLAIEAAHVRWHAAAGADDADNGLCLCTFHHKALDRGAIGLGDDHRLLVSQHVRGSKGINEWLLQYLGQRVSPPLKGEPPPSTGNLAWHRREVFREPARST
jgi:putative restriction endonuclease